MRFGIVRFPGSCDDVDAAHPLEAQRGQRALHRLALGVEDPLLGADQHARPHAAPDRTSQS